MVGNCQNMKCELKGTVNMKLQGGEKSNLENVIYVPQPVKEILSVSRLVAKGDTMGATKDRTTTKKNGVIMNLN